MYPYRVVQWSWRFQMEVLKFSACFKTWLFVNSTITTSLIHLDNTRRFIFWYSTTNSGPCHVSLVLDNAATVGVKHSIIKINTLECSHWRLNVESYKCLLGKLGFYHIFFLFYVGAFPHPHLGFVFTVLYDCQSTMSTTETSLLTYSQLCRQ